jgi:hypothetical protein
MVAVMRGGKLLTSIKVDGVGLYRVGRDLVGLVVQDSVVVVHRKDDLRPRGARQQSRDC